MKWLERNEGRYCGGSKKGKYVELPMGEKDMRSRQVTQLWNDEGKGTVKQRKVTRHRRS